MHRPRSAHGRTDDAAQIVRRVLMTMRRWRLRRNLHRPQVNDGGDEERTASTSSSTARTRPARGSNSACRALEQLEHHDEKRHLHRIGAAAQHRRQRQQQRHDLQHEPRAARAQRRQLQLPCQRRARSVRSTQRSTSARRCAWRGERAGSGPMAAAQARQPQGGAGKPRAERLRQPALFVGQHAAARHDARCGSRRTACRRCASSSDRARCTECRAAAFHGAAAAASSRAASPPGRRAGCWSSRTPPPACRRARRTATGPRSSRRSASAARPCCRSASASRRRGRRRFRGRPVRHTARLRPAPAVRRAPVSGATGGTVRSRA